MERKHYLLFGIMALIHFIAMYYFMYSMVDRGANVFHNINNLYMAALMTTPMLILEVLFMRQMYPEKSWNIVIVALGVLLLFGSWFAIREQTAVGNEQFLKSMIPHHAGAILMCAEAEIVDPEIMDLCVSITESQQREIDQMKGILQRLESTE
jgi:hypothetical protein